MIKVGSQNHRKEKDSTIALINIVFLMLIFFLIAGTIVPPLDNQVTPIVSEVEQNADLENALSVRANGDTYYQGKPISPEDYFADLQLDIENAGKPVRVLSDKELKAVDLVDIINRLQAAGAASVRVVTERKGT
ncbi:MAG: biopolymer transporter ExbD [Pseudomonadota bacterium]